MKVLTKASILICGDSTTSRSEEEKEEEEHASMASSLIADSVVVDELAPEVAFSDAPFFPDFVDEAVGDEAAARW